MLQIPTNYYLSYLNDFKYFNFNYINFNYRNLSHSGDYYWEPGGILYFFQGFSCQFKY